ncbi:phosphatase PAP2 family protein [Flagellimonas sp. DF-77]|uniref:phosphatase PAP2 family protein n=1 Tax=Flagellimonas algarum TaxID=3230298 RepID=UPI003396A854
MLEGLIQADERLFLYLNGLGTPDWDAFWMFLTTSKNSIPLYLVLVILCYRQFGIKGLLMITVATALMVTCTDQLSNFFKYGLRRLRPCHDPDIASQMRLVKSYCGGQYAYFSAHAANAFVVASFFSRLFLNRLRWLWPILLLWAILVAYSRIYIGVHFPLDVLTGGLVGTFFGWVFFKLYIFARNKIGG